MDRTTRWERAAEWPLTVVALVFLTAYALPIALPGLPGGVLVACEVAIWTAWAVFVADYLVRLSLASNRRRFIASNLLDLAVVVLPMLRPLRLIRLLALVSILHRTALKELRGKVAVYTAGGAALLVVIGALAITDAERLEPGANITTLGDGFWWALTTVTTVGYGDRFPVSATGRFVAAGLMVGGIALLGVVTATIASWLVQRVSEVTETEEAATRAQVELLTREVAALRADLAARGRAGHRDAGVTPPGEPGR
jgi:voltage-gated potassium channel